jgi:hypothetical protein
VTSKYLKQDGIVNNESDKITPACKFDCVEFFECFWTNISIIQVMQIPTIIRAASALNRMTSSLAILKSMEVISA